MNIEPKPYKHEPITDEQVRIALATWFEDQDYYTDTQHATKSEMSGMREVLENALKGGFK